MSFSAFVGLGAYREQVRCGYCGSEDTAHSYGFYSPLMTVQAYEAMLNRGWRRYARLNTHSLHSGILDSGLMRCARSGRYMYKPDMRNTCCRLYAVPHNLYCGIDGVDTYRGEPIQVETGT